MPAKEENRIKQAWHSFEEALHLREPVPPPVPPKDEKWLVKTVNLSVSQEEPDPSFWDKVVQRITILHAHPDDNDDENEAVSISVPADAAIQQLGISSDDKELQNKRNYFKRMASRCKEKFDEDNTQAAEQFSFSLNVEKDEDESQDSANNPHLHRHHRHLHHYFQALHRHFHPHESDLHRSQVRQHAHFVPKVDPKEMEAAHRILYHRGQETPADSEDDRKLFGSWWGWHKKSRVDKELEKQLDSEWEKIDLSKSNEDKRKSLGERNGALPVGSFSAAESKGTWWKRKSFDAEALVQQDKGAHGRKAITKRHQAIASAAAYEAVKEYHARKLRQGKKVSHGEVKAILAGMAMAEAIKLLESNHEENDDDKDETVAEAGSAAIKLFELLR
ncbi:hypothetical protein BGZ65_011848 [Modicella reniformis]|uniref:Uncharacterized protein n=1 Tax=Modicella reniformis TaxID=1440133 RepID=A0A9P6SQC3_9FUNG|nr:hypothetical protein BGZ65_011848 [Modicella reniformis]